MNKHPHGFYRVKLLLKTEVARNTLLFQFQKPPGFSFVAGQFGIWQLPDLSPDVELGNKRYFTIASPPYFDHLEIAIRKGITPFKKALENMKTGDEISLSGPFGSFILPEDTVKPIVFLCGGIGITPARSIILQTIHERASYNFYLFYSNKTPEDAAFFNEFAALSHLKKDIFKDILKDIFLSRYKSRLFFIPTMTDRALAKSAWQGERGFIDAAMLKRHLPNIREPIYYVVGPPGFVGAMEKMLDKAGVGGGSIVVEKFVGYN